MSLKVSNNGGKKKKYLNIINNLYKNLTNLSNHLENLFKNKYIEQEFYIEKMYALNDLNNKISILEKSLNKKNNKKFIEEFILEINDLFEKISFHIGSDTIYNLLKIFNIEQDFFNNKKKDFNELLSIYNSYFIPTNLSVSNNLKKIKEDNDIEDIEQINITEQKDLYYKKKKLLDKIDGACIIIYVNDDKIFLINGLFKKDSLGILKKYSIIENKNNLINKEIEYINIEEDFKNKYIEQLSLKEFLIYSPKEIATTLQNDYDEFIKFKNKSLSLLVKEFIKMNPEKQRKMLILFLIHDQESQFTAHIIYDLLTDQTFLFENEKLADVLFNSLHWKIQKIFKITNTNFENQKKKLENININDIPYESKILALNTSEYIKAKAIEKLKEVNGSKENSIKAQQWLDGFLKLPFGVYKKEKIIDFFGKFQIKMENFINTMALKISDYESIYLDSNNQNIFNSYNDIINEFHSNIFKSENIYDEFITFLDDIIKNIRNNTNKNKVSLEELIDDDDNTEFDIKTSEEFQNLLNKENDILIDEYNMNEYKKELEVFKKIKNDLYSSEIITKNNLKLMINKLNDIESKINKNLLKNKPENNSTESEEDDYDESFNKFNIKNIEEMERLISEWMKFKLNKKNYMKNVDKTLDQCTYGQTEAKIQMKRIIGQWMNGISKGQCIGLCGPPGVGKTTLCKNGLANCLVDDNGESRPFSFLPLGGATNGSILEGHHYTYLGSTWGKISDILMETKCMNPIIYIDELDKVSNTEHGREIISILTHITDQSQNKEFFDKYFASIPIDLSQVLFIFSYNNRDNIDRILLDRIQEINIEPLSIQEKLIITKNYICPEINKNIGFTNEEIIISNDLITDIVQKYTYEAGVRKLNELLYDMYREINLRKIYDDEVNYPFIIDNEFVTNIFRNLPEIEPKKINDLPKVGLVNGLYATKAGLGGLTIIQSKFTISDKKFGLEKLTGSQGDVMKESMDCAFTVLNNILTKKFKDDYFKNNEKSGIHIHCPEAATPKDGPSAGLAITLCLISLITKIPIKNDVAMTGEIDLEGNARQIGGLYSKLQGALNADVKMVLIPRSNEKDLDTIFSKEEQEIESLKNNSSIKNPHSYSLLNDNSYVVDKDTRMFRNKMMVRLVDNIYDILKYSLIDNKMKFNTEL